MGKIIKMSATTVDKLIMAANAFTTKNNNVLNITNNGYKQTKYNNKLLSELTDEELILLGSALDDVTLEEDTIGCLCIISDWYYWKKEITDNEILNDLIRCYSGNGYEFIEKVIDAE